MAQNPAQTPKADAPAKPSSPATDPVASVEERMERLMARVEHTLRSTEERPRFFSGWRNERPSIINIGWDVHERFHGLKKGALIVGALLIAAGAYYTQFVRIPHATPLPYIHPSTIVFVNDHVYIVEWFRKALYDHRYKRDFPITNVENIPNNFLSGVAFSDKYLWTLDAFNRQIIQHSLGNDHRVLKTFPTPGGKPGGLFWDGIDLWSADSEEMKIYRHFGADPESIKTEYAFTDFNVSALYYKENRLWILDAKSRMVYLCRLEDPLRKVAVYDLDPLLKGASPTSFTMKGETFWLLTENPPQLLQVSPRQLNKLRVNQSAI